MFGREKPQIVRIAGNITWKFAHDPDSGMWIGICDALNANALGDTYGEAQECAVEAMTLLFESLFEDGEFEDFLRDHGWQAHDGVEPGGPTPRFDVPYQVQHVHPEALMARA